MRTITTIGIDLAKKVFQVHGVDAEGKVVVARKLRRKEVLAFFAKLAPCLVGSALRARVTDAKLFENGRHLAAAARDSTRSLDARYRT